MSKGRTEAFSDGILAVAITLLVLNLHVASGSDSLWRQIAHTWPSFAAYVVSFFVIGVIWVNHHSLFALIDHVALRHLRHRHGTLLHGNAESYGAPWAASGSC
jgi:uncharacterized membrane protein